MSMLLMSTKLTWILSYVPLVHTNMHNLQQKCAFLNLISYILIMFVAVTAFKLSILLVNSATNEFMRVICKFIIFRYFTIFLYQHLTASTVIWYWISMHYWLHDSGVHAIECSVWHIELYLRYSSAVRLDCIWLNLLSNSFHDYEAECFLLHYVRMRLKCISDCKRFFVMIPFVSHPRWSSHVWKIEIHHSDYN